MVNNLQTEQEASSITVFNEPLSKVRYLETILEGKDWRTDIIFPKDQPHASESLNETAKALRHRGYHVVVYTNQNNDAALSIRHYGAGTEIRDLIRDKGLASGVGYSIAHPNIPLHQLMKTSSGVFNEIGNFFKNPASANGLIFVAAEVFLTAAGFGNKSAAGKKESLLQRMRQPRNYLQSLAGALFLSQSIVYMLFAKNNEQQAMEALNKKTDALEKEGNKNPRITFDLEKDGPNDNLSGRFGRFLKQNPVQIGAVFNDVGMLAYMGHAFYNRRFHLSQLKTGIHAAARSSGKSMKSIESTAEQIIATRKNTGLLKSKEVRQAAKSKLEQLEKSDTKLFELAEDLINAKKYTEGGIWKSGFCRDVGGAITSLIGWSILLIPSKKKTDEEKQKEKDNVHTGGVFNRIGQKLKDDPEIITGVLALTSSMQRLLGSLSKRNFLQTIGESIYIPGDILLMFTKNSEYAGGHADVDKLSKHIAEDLNSQAWLLGPTAQRSLAKDTAIFIRDRAIADMSIDKNKEPLTPEQLAAQTMRLENSVYRRIAYTQSERFDALIDSTANLIQRVPYHLRQKLATQLTKEITTQPWVHVLPEEFTAALAINMKARTLEMPTVKHIQELGSELKELIGNAPEKVQSMFTIKLHETIANVAKAAEMQTPSTQINQPELHTRLSEAAYLQALARPS